MKLWSRFGELQVFDFFAGLGYVLSNNPQCKIITDLNECAVLCSMLASNKIALFSCSCFFVACFVCEVSIQISFLQWFRILVVHNSVQKEVKV